MATQLDTTGADDLLDAYLECDAELALSTADPGTDGSTIAEPVGDGYDRAAISAATWAAASGGAKSNGVAVTFPEATGDGWGTVTWVCRFVSDAFKDALSLDEGVAVTAGKIPRFAVGVLEYTAAAVA